MVGGDGIAKNSQATGVRDGGSRRGLKGKILEERRLLNVGAFAIPSIGQPGFAGNFVPSGVLLGEVPVQSAKNFRLQSGLHGLSDLLAAGPKIPEVDGLAVLSETQRILGEIEVYATGQGKGYNERGGHQKVGFDGRVDAGLKVAVTGKNAGGDEIVLHHRLFHRSGKGARIADAGGASVSDQIESELVEVGLKPRGVEVIGDHARSGGQRGFDG